MGIDFENELNAQQFAGVVATEGPVLVLAGAGSGKTRMLTYKLAYLVHEVGIDPRCIFAVTFTNKAANEMKERVQTLLGSELKATWLGTFHSLCGKILRIDGEAIGIPSDYIIYDAEDSIHLLRNIIHDFGLDVKIVLPKKVASAISRLKRKLIDPDKFKSTAIRDGERTIARIYQRYEEMLRSANAVDFDDMISLVVKMLEHRDDLRNKYSQKFHYILVDEFQDTNESQFSLLRNLTAMHNNITVVGDDDQSIYSWRGAQVRNILEFPKIYHGCKIIRLERNYRSTGHILNAASAVIAHNTMRHKKKLYTTAGAGERVCTVHLPDERAEAKYITDKIEELISDGTMPGDIAVLYRINALSRIFEQEFRMRNIPYVVVGGVGFYERAEIKDILAYLRLIVNPADDISFRRVVNVPRRKIGSTTLNALSKMAADAEMSMLEYVDSGLPLPVNKVAQRSLQEFAKMLAQFRSQMDEAAPSLIIREVIQQTGYLEMLKSENSVRAQTRIENIGQLIEAAQEFEYEQENINLKNFLEVVTLMTDVDRWHRSSETVNLMTVHAAKGLEFDAVFIAGAELGIFPLIRTLAEDAKMEEERRLFYVAMTRAKKLVNICFTSNRGRFGNIEKMSASPFVKELPKSEINYIDLAPKSSIIADTIGTSKKTKFEKRAKAESEFASGTKVFHPFFGDGVVIAVRGESERAILTVDFKKFGRKKLVARFAKLKRK